MTTLILHSDTAKDTDNGHILAIVPVGDQVNDESSPEKSVGEAKLIAKLILEARDVVHSCGARLRGCGMDSCSLDFAGMDIVKDATETLVPNSPSYWEHPVDPQKESCFVFYDFNQHICKNVERSFREEALQFGDAIIPNGTVRLYSDLAQLRVVDGALTQAHRDDYKKSCFTIHPIGSARVVTYNLFESIKKKIKGGAPNISPELLETLAVGKTRQIFETIRSQYTTKVADNTDKMNNELSAAVWKLWPGLKEIPELRNNVGAFMELLDNTWRLSRGFKQAEGVDQLKERSNVKVGREEIIELCEKQLAAWIKLDADCEDNGKFPNSSRKTGSIPSPSFKAIIQTLRSRIEMQITHRHRPLKIMKNGFPQP